MGRFKLIQRLKRRKRLLIWLSIVSVVIIIVMIWSYGKMTCKTLIFNLSTMIASALISTLLAIHMTKDDIMENDYSEKKEYFGILTFENGYRSVFQNNEAHYFLKANCWKQFFRDSKDHKVVIVAVHANGFFEDDEIRKCLLELCLENEFKVYIFLANPYSEEVIQESYAEQKTRPDHIKKKIINTYEMFQDDINKLDQNVLNNENKPSHILKNRFNIKFSNTLPKALIFRTGQYMVVSPYSFESPEKAPTLIVESSKANAFYDNYERYIDKLNNNSVNYENIRKHISPNAFFDQKYRELSKEFKEELKNCTSLDILGLGQKHMISQLGSQFVSLVQRNATLRVVLGDPNGSSTVMCVQRSLRHDNVQEAVEEHMIAINELIRIKKTYSEQNVNVYIWDCFFPYTLYIFNYDPKRKNNKNKSIKIFVWLTNLFEEADKRQGFIVDEKMDKDIVESYIKQYNSVLTKAKEIKQELFNKSCN